MRRKNATQAPNRRGLGAKVFCFLKTITCGVVTVRDATLPEDAADVVSIFCA